MLMTISLEMSIRKLVRLTAHTLRGSWRMPIVAGGVVSLVTGDLVDIMPRLFSEDVGRARRAPAYPATFTPIRAPTPKVIAAAARPNATWRSPE